MGRVDLGRVDLGRVDLGIGAWAFSDGGKNRVDDLMWQRDSGNIVGVFWKISM